MINLNEKLERTCDNGIALTLSGFDFHTADAAFVYDHMDNAITLINNCVDDLNNGAGRSGMPTAFKLLIITVLFLVCFKAPKKTIDAIVALLELVDVPEKELKEIIQEVLKDSEIISSLNRCVREVLNVKK